MSLGIPELCIILLIVLMLFGTKKLRGLGYDLGMIIRSFRETIGGSDDDDGKIEKQGHS